MTVLARRFKWAVIFGTGTFFVGVTCLWFGNMAGAKLLAIWPLSFVFYFIPDAVTHQWSEAVLFWVGLISAIAFWSVVFVLLSTLGSRLRTWMACGSAVVAARDTLGCAAGG